MRRPRRHAVNLRKQMEQFNLFGPPLTISDLPAWRTLPEETRQTVMSLMARLILDHRHGDRHPTATEAANDV